ncbi:MAG: Maf family protein [Bacteriovoracaceae bacterium]
MKYNLILASGSPRRKEFISFLEIPFQIKVLHTEENSNHTNPADLAMEIAESKGRVVLESELQTQKSNYFPFVVAADTIVTFNNQILGKPTDAEHAKVMLRMLAAREHDVITAVYIGFLNRETKKIVERSFFCKTIVEFAEISEIELDAYIKTKDPLDKAGSYGIQGHALTFIKKVNGSYSNVVGLPIFELKQAMIELINPKNSLQSEFN